MAGIAAALKAFVKIMSPSPINNFKSFSTTKYKYNIYESATGLKLIILSTVDEYDYSDLLRTIFFQLIFGICQ